MAIDVTVATIIPMDMKASLRVVKWNIFILPIHMKPARISYNIQL